MVKLIIFDLDNTLTDFMRMKDESIVAAIRSMIDAGLDFPEERINEEIYRIYDEEGIEYQKVFNKLLVGPDRPRRLPHPRGWDRRVQEGPRGGARPLPARQPHPADAAQEGAAARSHLRRAEAGGLDEALLPRPPPYVRHGHRLRGHRRTQAEPGSVPRSRSSVSGSSRPRR